ncbi:MAG: glycosyltransferase family 1 protein [Desulfobacteraceae bacterium]
MPKRILHIVGGMNRGGVETWLLHVLRHSDSSCYHHDFLVHTNQTCAYDEDIRSSGSRIIPCPFTHRPLSYAREFKRLLRLHGPYDIVHSHVHFYSGFTLRLAHQVGVPVRIAHSHSDTKKLQAKAGLPRRLYLALMKKWLNTYATAGLACSRPAAAALFGSDWQNDGRWQVLHNGIDLNPFFIKLNTTNLRSELGIPRNAFVIGHVGRFFEPKNHAFLVDIALEIAKREPTCYFLLVGDGPLRPPIEEKFAQAGLAAKTIFAGARADVPFLMRRAMDVFLFPSLFEGLGLVLVEAQASGLPCIISDVVPREAEVVKTLVQRLSLGQPPSVWAEAVLEARHSSHSITKEQALAMVEQSPFNILSGVKSLEQVYAGNDIIVTHGIQKKHNLELI